MDVTNLARGWGLTEVQSERLEVLERAKNLTGFELGEAAFLATQATAGEQRNRALAVADRKVKPPKVGKSKAKK